MRTVVLVLFSFFLLYLFVFWFLRNPNLPLLESADLYSVVPVSHSLKRADADRMKKTVVDLSSIEPSRSSINPKSLNLAAEYITDSWSKVGCSVREQRFLLRGREYKNLICSFGPRNKPRVILGAHYDVHFNNNPGADDNASGIAALIELAQLINNRMPNLSHRLDLVAYTLEEQPHFHTSDMGSFVHARQLSKESAIIKLMVSVEMIGYFSDVPGSQSYPNGLLKLFYPNRGDFLGVVGLSLERKLVRRVRNLISTSTELPVYSINSPKFIPGIDLSDHRNFWKFGYPALMVTDTAFYRNPNYHRPTDTADSLDYNKMVLVVEGLYQIAVRF